MSTETVDDAQQSPPGCDLAIAAEAFYVTNMILAPGLGLLMLVFLYVHCARKHAAPLAMNHLRQAIAATVWSAVALAVFIGLVFATGGYPSPYFWPLLTIYFLCFHLPLSWFGIKGLGKALCGECYRYPFVGRALLPDRPAGAH
jgi:hypothetical protein